MQLCDTMQATRSIFSEGAQEHATSRATTLSTANASLTNMIRSVPAQQSNERTVVRDVAAIAQTLLPMLQMAAMVEERYAKILAKQKGKTEEQITDTPPAQPAPVNTILHKASCCGADQLSTPGSWRDSKIQCEPYLNLGLRTMPSSFDSALHCVPLLARPRTAPPPPPRADLMNFQRKPFAGVDVFSGMPAQHPSARLIPKRHRPAALRRQQGYRVEFQRTLPKFKQLAHTLFRRAPILPPPVRSPTPVRSLSSLRAAP